MKSIFFALLASIVWGSAPILFKLGLRGEMHPLTALVFHNLSAFTLALLFVLLTGQKFGYPIKEIALVVAGGMASGFLGLFLFFKAVKGGEVSVVSPIASTSPLWSSLLAFLLLGEPFSWLRFAGIVLIVCGIALISLSVK